MNNNTKFITKYPALSPEKTIEKLGLVDEKEYNKIFKEVHGKTYNQFMKSIPKNHTVVVTGEIKPPVEVLKNVTIFWSTKTVRTDLGNFGIYECGFDQHGAIQRAFVTMYGNTTSATIAMRYSFMHAKAMLRYARIHGFQKSSGFVTDIELLEGTTIEDYQTEVIQHRKKVAFEKAQQAIWIETEKNATKYLDWKHKIVKPLENLFQGWMDKPIEIPIMKWASKTHLPNQALFVGMADWHYLKLCYDHTGKFVYDADIAKDRIHRHTKAIIHKALHRANIKEIILMVGNDGIHVDGPGHTTTAGTPQITATSNQYYLELEPYMQINRDYIESFAQIASVRVIVIRGNHDERTSALLGAALKSLYKDNPRVTVINEQHSRIYTTYATNGFMVTHGTNWSEKKLQDSAHKIIMSEAKGRGINVQKITRWYIISNHYHRESMKDLNGFIHHFVVPSLSASAYFDDNWHTHNAFIGREPKSAGYLFDPIDGLDDIFYVK